MQATIHDVLGPDAEGRMAGVYLDPANPSRYRSDVDFSGGEIFAAFKYDADGKVSEVTMYPAPAGTFRPRPGGELIVDRSVRAFIGGWFSAETGGNPEEIRRGVLQSAPAFQERLREGLHQILTDRIASVDDFWNPTWIVDNDEEFYQGLQEAYDLLFADAEG